VSRLRGILGILLFACSALATPVFNLTYVPGTPANAQAAFQMAAAQWTGYFTDNVTINLTIGFKPMPSGINAGSATLGFYSYEAVRNALMANVTSTADASTVSHLQPGDLDLLINRTLDNPNGPGSVTPYVDNDGGSNNTTLQLTNANAKALGLAITATSAPTGCVGNALNCDAFIMFNSNLAWDFDPTNGITPGTYDLVALTLHDMGEAMGFLGGVKILNNPQAGAFPDDAFRFVHTLELFRYSHLSFQSGVIDWSADTRERYFSIDGGATAIALMTNGAQGGEHWKDNLGLGIFDPTLSPGELGVITANDRLALDVMGWDPVRTNDPPGTHTPEPGSLLLSGLGLLAAALIRRNRQP